LFLRGCGRYEQQSRDHYGSLLEAEQIHGGFSLFEMGAG
jgi:hypothetical protein